MIARKYIIHENCINFCEKVKPRKSETVHVVDYVTPNRDKLMIQ